jgi:hypothetical protein
MTLRVFIIVTTLAALACSTEDAPVTAQESLNRGGDGVGSEPSKTDRGQLTDVEWANQFFVTQIYDERFNPQGIEEDAGSNNCGPASLAMLSRQREPAHLERPPEVAIDHARAMMYPDYPEIDPATLSDGATVYTHQGLILVDDDTHPVFFDLVDDAPSISQGILSGGATPVFGHSWAQLNQLLETSGAVIAHGHITDAWRGQFSTDYGVSDSGPVSHFIAIFSASTGGQFIVCDPMYRGGAVVMNRYELGVFFRSPVNVYETTIRAVSWDAPPLK